MRRFGAFAGIDWSGAAGEFHRGITLAACTAGGGAPALIAPGGRLWSRPAILDWLTRQADDGADLLIGIDFSPALPFVDRGAYLPGWPDPAADAGALWRLVDALCEADAHLGVAGFVERASAHYRRAGGREGAAFGGGLGRLRIVEAACRIHGLGPAQSGFNLVGPAQVGKASLAGMRLLARLNGRIPIWPFDPVPTRGPLIVEIYTAVAARAAGVRGRTKVRDAAALDHALRSLGTAAHVPLARYDDHSTDALLAAAWLRQASGERMLWVPPPPAIARTEGWTFGVPYSKEAAGRLSSVGRAPAL